MKKILSSFFVFIFYSTYFISHTSAQPPAIQWQKSLGGSGTELGGGWQRHIQTSDGGYIIAGISNSNDGDVSGNHGGNDYWVVKLDGNGNITWQKSLGGSGDDVAKAIEQTADGGYIVVGGSTSTDGDVTFNHGSSDYWVVKLDTGGNITWQKSFGGSGHETAFAVDVTTDGGYIVTGYSGSINGDVTNHHGANDFWVVKLDSIGNLIWQKSLGGSSTDQAYSIEQTVDGGYIAAGFSYSADGDVTGHYWDSSNPDYWVVKLDGSGNLTWQKSLGGIYDDWGTAICQTSDGGYIVAGHSKSHDHDVIVNHGMHDYWVAKLDVNGNIIWQKSLGGSSDEIANYIQQTSDGGYIITGWSYSTDGDVTTNHGINDCWVVKLDASGNISWQKSMGGSDRDYGYCIQQTSDAGYIVGGHSLSTDGDVTGNHGDYDIWVVKLLPSVGINDLYANQNSFSIYPNPSNDQFTLSFNTTMSQASIKIFNMMGVEVYSQFVDGKQETVKTNLSSGIYFVKVTDNEKECVQKLIVRNN